MAFNNGLELRFGDLPIYPYQTPEEASKDLDHAQKHFEEMFAVKTLRGGYILTSKNIILDVRGYVVSTDNPLEGALQSFQAIIAESKDHTY